MFNVTNKSTRTSGTLCNRQEFTGILLKAWKISKYCKLTKAAVNCKPKKEQEVCSEMCGLDFGNVNLNLNLYFNEEATKGKD